MFRRMLRHRVCAGKEKGYRNNSASEMVLAIRTCHMVLAQNQIIPASEMKLNKMGCRKQLGCTVYLNKVVGEFMG